MHSAVKRISQKPLQVFVFCVFNIGFKKGPNGELWLILDHFHGFLTFRSSSNLLVKCCVNAVNVLNGLHDVSTREQEQWRFVVILDVIFINSSHIKCIISQIWSGIIRIKMACGENYYTHLKTDSCIHNFYIFFKLFQVRNAQLGSCCISSENQTQ